MERLVAAAAEEAEERPYADISVRTIAKRAGVAPATAYTYFSGKDHLLAEVLWRRMQSSPSLVDLTLPLPDRVADTVRTMGFGAMGSPAVAVCTTALLGDGPDVKRVRSRLGAEIGRRLEGALGQRRRPGGARRAAGHLHGRAAQRRHGASRLRRRAHADGRGDGVDDDGSGRCRDHAATGVQPVRLRDPRGSVPDVRPPARRGARLLQRGARLLRLRAPCRRAGGVPRRRPLLERLRRQPRPRRLRARRAPGHVVPRHGPAAPHAHALHCREELHAAPGGRHGGGHPGAHALPRRPCPRERARSTSSPTSPGCCRWT